MSVAVTIPAAAAAVAPSGHTSSRVSAELAPFAMAPVAVVRDATLSVQARFLYVVLDARQGQSGSVRVRISTLCQDTGASSASVRRWLDELRDAGLVATQATGRSLAIYVSNASRQSARVLTRERTREHRECSPVSALQRHNKRDTSSSPAEQPPAPPPAPPGARDGGDLPQEQPAPGAPDRDYLAAIESSTSHRLRPTTAVRSHLAAIRRAAVSPAETAALASAYLAMHGSTIRNPASWLASFALDAIANGQRPQQLELTYAPPSYRELTLDAMECEHGEPRGERYCALCRHRKSSSNDHAWLESAR